MFYKFYSYGETYFREEFKNVCRKKLFESFVVLKPVYLVKIFGSDFFSVVQIQCIRENAQFVQNTTLGLWEEMIAPKNAH